MVRINKPPPKTMLKKVQFHYTADNINTERTIKTSSSEYCQKIEDYFKTPDEKVLKNSELPFDYNTVPAKTKLSENLPICRVIIHGKNSAWMQFRLKPRTKPQAPKNQTFIIQPSHGERAEDLNYELQLDKASILKEGDELELTGRCLSKTEEAEDEVSKEILYCLNFYSRKIRPWVNTHKQMTSRNLEKKRRKIDLDYVYQVSKECQVVMQSNLIFRNIQLGVQDKNEQCYMDRVAANEEYELTEFDCSVCFNCSEEDTCINPKVYCSGCRLFIHKACHGIQVIPEEFLCQLCRTGSNPRCFLCTRSKGPMKLAGKKWFHISCALWDPKRVEFEDKQQLEGLKVTGETRIGGCLVCKESSGLLTKCVSCEGLCHLMCAWRKGMKFFVEELPTTTVRKLGVSFKCSEHLPKSYLKLQRVLRKTPYKYYINPRLKQKRPRM